MSCALGTTSFDAYKRNLLIEARPPGCVPSLADNSKQGTGARCGEPKIEADDITLLGPCWRRASRCAVQGDVSDSPGEHRIRAVQRHK